MVSWYRCAVLLSRDSYDLVAFFHLAALQRERDLGVGPSMAWVMPTPEKFLTPVLGLLTGAFFLGSA
jgi:hypothetical protein